ncbi:MAG: helix-turn-helix transcriptional regulator [Candidatus Hodarchaeales archaeon]|jgi:predicted ArsR family transcriptional regulator
MTSIDNEASSSTREKILQYLLVHPFDSEGNMGITVIELAESLNISPNGVRQQLGILEKDQLVVLGKRRGKTGRPAIVYFLHENAMDYFPKLYSHFSTLFVEEFMDQYGKVATRNFLERLGKRIVKDIIEDLAQTKIDPKKSLEQALIAIKHIYEEYGKFPELIEEKDSFLLRNYNCLVYSILKGETLVCEVDEAILKELLGFRPIKENCIRDGDGYCQYRIMKSESMDETA